MFHTACLYLSEALSYHPRFSRLFEIALWNLVYGVGIYPHPNPDRSYEHPMEPR